MKPNWRIMVIFGAVGVVISFLVSSYAEAVDVQSSVQIVGPGTCGVNVGGSLNYGSLKGGDISAEQRLVVANTGNTAVQVAALGTDWTSNNQLYTTVDATHFGLQAGQPYASKTKLTSSPPGSSLGSIPPAVGRTAGLGITTFWQFQGPVNSAFQGTAQQVVSLIGSC